MFYYLYGQSYSDFESYGLWEGPPGVNVEKLNRWFNDQFNHVTLGTPKHPQYTGSMIPLKYGSCASGSLSEGTMMFDQSSPEFKAWEKEQKKANKEWDDRRKKKVDEWREKYPGNTEFDMFLSYLVKEHGFKKVDCEEVNL